MRVDGATEHDGAECVRDIPERLSEVASNGVDARRADAVGPKPRVYVETIDRILAHAREHPTVFLPSHDRDSVERLSARTTL